MKLHHLGYAVRSIEQAHRVFEAMGYTATGDVYHDTSRNVNILFMELKGTLVELISPLDESQPSPVTQLVKKSASTLYHPCYKVDDIAATVSALQDKGFRVLHDFAYALAIGEKSVVAFLHNPQTGIIELCQ